MMISLYCPNCISELKENESTLRCTSCLNDFKIIEGIVDLRVSDPLENSKKDDMIDAEHLSLFGQHSTLEELIMENANISKKRILRGKKLLNLYTEISLSAEKREINRFNEFDFIVKKYKVPFFLPEIALDLGTGMGPAIPHLAERFNHVVAVDISLKHLVIAKKRCQERGCQNVTYVCASAEKLPFRGFFFSFVNSTDVLEHVANNKLYIKEIERVLKKGGSLWGSTPNRFTILPEGHVKLWGVGFLPRGLQKYYVNILKNTSYVGIHPVSYRELYRLISIFFEKYHIVLPMDINEVILPHPGIKASRLWKIAKFYWDYNNRHRRIRKVGYFLEKIFYPQFRFLAIKY